MGGGIFGKDAAKVGEMQWSVGFVEDGRYRMSCTGHCLVNCDTANQSTQGNKRIVIVRTYQYETASDIACLLIQTSFCIFSVRRLPVEVEERLRVVPL